MRHLFARMVPVRTSGTSVFKIAATGSGQTEYTTMTKFSHTEQTKRKDLFLAAWNEYAPTETLGGLTLAQFQTEVQKPNAVRARLKAAQAQVRGITLERTKADELLNEQFVRIANSVRGNPEYGVDSPFYRALGFVPKSERKRPRRRSTQAPATAPHEETPADAA